MGGYDMRCDGYSTSRPVAGHDSTRTMSHPTGGGARVGPTNVTSDRGCDIGLPDTYATIQAVGHGSGRPVAQQTGGGALAGPTHVTTHRGFGTRVGPNMNITVRSSPPPASQPCVMPRCATHNPRTSRQCANLFHVRCGRTIQHVDTATRC